MQLPWLKSTRRYNYQGSVRQNKAPYLFRSPLWGSHCCSSYQSRKCWLLHLPIVSTYVAMYTSRHFHRSNLIRLPTTQQAALGCRGVEVFIISSLMATNSVSLLWSSQSHLVVSKCSHQWCSAVICPRMVNYTIKYHDDILIFLFHLIVQT